ncbi:MAG: replicative DNA helicase [Ruminococcus sp.]|nr:replicative DNA helicase [Ruminococcus sp.]
MDFTTDIGVSSLPVSLEAEQTVLGGILIDAKKALPVVIERVKADFFYSEQHRAIFAIMQRMFTSNQNVDILTVANEAQKMGVFETDVMARTYLKGMAESVPSVSNIESYCDILEEKYYLRSLILAAREIIDNAENASLDAKTLLDSAEQKIYDIRKGKDAEGLTKIDSIILDSYQHLQQITGEDREKYLGAKSGFSQLDRITGGLNNSDLIILAARPGVGKSAFAVNIAVNMCKRSNKEVAVFSLEMGKEQLVTRMLSSEALVSNTSLRSGYLEVEDWNKLAAGAAALSELPIYIDDTGGITVPQMKAKLRRMRNLGLVIIDYLQLMESVGNHSNRVNEVSEITRQLKLMAKEINVPVICLSQLARGPENRQDHRPMLADLRESGSIEQDADIVLFLYRDGYYNKEAENQSEAECIVSKNRHGETGTVNLAWLGEYTLFRSIDTTARQEN